MNDDERNAAAGDDRAATPVEEPFAGRAGALATEVLVSTLTPSELPAGGWDRLSRAVADEVAGEAAAPGTGGAGTIEAAYPPPAARRPLAYLAALAVAVVALGSVGAWGLVQRSEAARLRDDQRILAYWMSNPEMEMTVLEPAADVPSARLGVLCRLPDGRALVLQPNRAEPGTTYVVVGWGAAGLRELARGPENMLQFDVSGVDVVELRTQRGELTQTLAVAHLD
ncbi:MAG TPA: hypothetical protein VF202_09090 [Trueperaceae bacterium]